MMRRIAFISTIGGSAWGGSEELWSRAARRLAKEGVEVGVSVRWAPNPAKQIATLEADGCRVARRGKVTGLRHRLARRLLPAGEYQRLDRSPDRFALLDEGRWDLAVISLGGSYGGIDWMQACARRGIPYVVIVQAASESGWPPEGEECVEAMEGARACCFVSEGNRDLVRRQLGSPLHNARVVRNPFNVAYDAAPEWPETEGVWRLACVGRLQPGAKGQDVLFSVLAQEKWRSRPLEVSLFGSGGHESNLRRLAALYGLENVHFAGFCPDVESIWAGHHALVMPSRCEGLPLAVVEAMLCNRLCIVTDVPGNAEMIEDGVNGFVAAAPTVRFVDEALERAWARREEWKAMGSRAGTHVRERIPSDPVGVFADALRQMIEEERVAVRK